MRESTNNHYRDLDFEQSIHVKELIEERYWNAVDFVAAIMADRAEIQNHLKELIENQKVENQKVENQNE